MRLLVLLATLATVSGQGFGNGQQWPNLFNLYKNFQGFGPFPRKVPQITDPAQKFFHTLSDGSKVCSCWDPLNGRHEHDSSWISALKFKLRCNNGTTEVQACIGSRSHNYVEVPVNDTKEVNGFYHKCTETDGTINYEQEPSCLVNGDELHINETFRQNNFKMQCETWGYSIAGCFYGNDTELEIGATADEENLRHFCEAIPDFPGRVRYRVQAVKCKLEETIYEEGESWNGEHLKYLCKENGAITIINCVTANGTEIGVGQAIVVDDSLHRCWREGNTVFYRANKCVGSPACQSGGFALPSLPAWLRPAPFRPTFNGEYPMTLNSRSNGFMVQGRPFFKR